MTASAAKQATAAAGPAYYTKERELWDKVRKEVRGLPTHWPPGSFAEAQQLGYFDELAHEAWP